MEAAVKITERRLREIIREQLTIAICEVSIHADDIFLTEEILAEENIFKRLYDIIFAKGEEEEEDIGAEEDEEFTDDADGELGIFGIGGGDVDAVAVAEEEYRKWDGRHERDPMMRFLLKKYWKAAGQDSLARSDRPWKEPWSAAFISYLKKDDSSFPGGPAHKRYMRKARENRQKILDAGGSPGTMSTHGVSKRDPVAYLPTEKTPSPGDLVCNPRGTGDGFDDVGSKNHCDIFVGGNEVIGGNLSNTVTKRPYDASKVTMIISQDSRPDPKKMS